MKTSTTIIWIVVILVIIVGGIYWFTTQNTTSQSPASQQATTTAQATMPTLMLASSAQFPSYLAAGRNMMALYTYGKDTSGVSNCTGTCAAIWPPYTVPSASGLSVGSNIPGTIGTITRSDGTLQVTYNGMPLYFFAKDTQGQVTGNGQGNFYVAMATSPSAQSQNAAPQTTAPAQPAPTKTKTTPTNTTPTPYTPPAYNY